MEKTLGFLAVMSAVTLVANDKLEGNPLITPLLDKRDGSPKVDLVGNELGSIRLEQNSRNLNGSYLNTRKRVAFIGGPIEDLKNLLGVNKLKEGSELPGKIVIKESLSPMWEGQNWKINPQSGEEIGVMVNGKLQNVYMKMIYTEDMTDKDSLIRTEDDVLRIWNSRKIAEAVDTNQSVQSAAVPQ
jgi:hypothetical protein